MHDLFAPRRTSAQGKSIADRIDASGDCWEWTGGKSSGYGSVRDWDGEVTRAHTLVFEALVGPVPTGMELDHLCRVRHCVNPDHLEVVTKRENILRGYGHTAQLARRPSHCVHGSPYYIKRNYRVNDCPFH